MKKISKKEAHRPVPIRRAQSGFSLIELMLAMGVVLILVGGIAFAGSRVARAGRETTASQNVATLASHEATFYHEWSGYSPLAANLGGSENSATAQATFAADQEVPTAEGTALDGGFVNGGYTIQYKAGGTPYLDSAGNSVNPIFEFTAIPINVSDTKATCSDNSGTWFNTLGSTATVATGAGCKTDGYLSQ